MPKYERGMSLPIGPGGWDPEKTAEKTDASEEAKAREKAEMNVEVEKMQSFLDKHLALLRLMAGSDSLRFVAHEGEGFFFDLKSKPPTVSMSARDYRKWRTEKGCTERQLLWIALHELGHFRDMRENPVGMLAQFEKMKQLAKELQDRAISIIRGAHGNEVAEKYLRETPGFEGNPTPYIQMFLYKKIHMLFNSVDDMYVNGGIPSVAAIFRPTGVAGDEVANLYRILFAADPETGIADYSEDPRSHQFTNAILRRRMLPDDPLVISDEVEAVLASYPDKAAELAETTLADQLNQVTTFGRKANLDPVKRYAAIERFALKPFIELLMKDLADMPPPQEPPTGGGGGGGGGGKGGDGPPGQGSGGSGGEVPGPEGEGDGGDGPSGGGRGAGKGKVVVDPTVGDVGDQVNCEVNEGPEVSTAASAASGDPNPEKIRDKERRTEKMRDIWEHNITEKHADALRVLGPSL